MLGKYFKPRSLTWWGGFIPVIAGLIVATAEVHGSLTAVTVIDNITGGIPAAALINSGLVVIGLRGAIK